MEISDRFLLVDQLNGVTHSFVDADALVVHVKAEFDFDPTNDESFGYVGRPPVSIIGGQKYQSGVDVVWVRLTERDPWVSRLFLYGHADCYKYASDEYFCGSFWCTAERCPDGKPYVWYQMKLKND